MVTALADGLAAKRENAAESGAPVHVPLTPTITPNPAPLPPIPQAVAGDGNDPQDFQRANRIHVKDGSLFIDSYLVIHPRELAPTNEAQLRKKLLLTYAITNPSFFEAPERMAVAMNLGQLVPVSLAAKRAQLVGQVNQFNAQVKHHGIDPALTREATDKRHPMTAIARDTVESQPTDPAGLELLKNGLALYMLMREKLTLNGYTGRLSDYVTRTANSEQVLGDLAPHIGVDGRAVREAALQGGIDGVGKLLGLDPRYVADVKELADYAATQEFGYNLVEHWHLGRQLLGVNASLQDKIVAGIDARIDSKIAEYRARVHYHYDVAAPVKAEEVRIADALKLVEPIQRKLAYALGYEICFSPEMTADDIAFHKGVYGLHRKSANDLRDIRGTYRVYFSGKGDLEGSMRTLVHELAHNLWPEQFTPQQTAQIDMFAASDQQRFAMLNHLLLDPQLFGQFATLVNAYKAGNPQEKAAVVAAADQLFAPLHLQVGALLPHLSDPYQLRHLVNYANDVLQVEGDRYNKSGYESPQERFREVISRFAELKQVRLRGEPELLNFIAPGLNRVWEQYYIPHLETMYQHVLVNNDVPQRVRSVGKSARDEVPAAEPKTEAQAAPQQQQPGTSACNADLGLPSNKVDVASMQFNSRTLCARETLDAMGVQHAF